VKVYAVKQGRTTGLFFSWAECSASILGFSDARYKSFKSVKEAQDYLADRQSDTVEQPSEQKQLPPDTGECPF